MKISMDTQETRHTSPNITTHSLTKINIQKYFLKITKSLFIIYRFSILVDINPGIRTSAIHPIVSDEF